MFGMRFILHHQTKCYAYNMTESEHSVVHTRDGLAQLEVCFFTRIKNLDEHVKEGTSYSAKHILAMIMIFPSPLLMAYNLALNPFRFYLTYFYSIYSWQYVVFLYFVDVHPKQKTENQCCFC